MWKSSTSILKTAIFKTAGGKLHIPIAHNGEIVRCCLSYGHGAEIKKIQQLVNGSAARVYADRGYISRKLKDKLALSVIDLITCRRKNWQAAQLPFSDEYHLRPRNKIETLFGLLNTPYRLTKY